MATLLPNVRQQFLDGNGLPLVGGKLYSYAAGTSTPQATFTDQSEATPNANPTILDANGMASVWMGEVSYKFTLTDSLGNILWTVDNVAAIFDGSVTTLKIANLAVTTGKIAVGALSADSAGRALMAAQYVTTALIADQAVTSAKIANATLTATQMTAGIGFIPTGACVPFFGTTLPTGFLWCDGTSYLRASYSGLFAAIGTACGTVDATHFSVPDLRGRFLRGADAIPSGPLAGNDPEPNFPARFPMTTGGNSGINVGSVQMDQYTQHYHAIALKDASGNGTVSQGTNGVTSTGSTQTAQVGGSETRPKNAYCHYIIKT